MIPKRVLVLGATGMMGGLVLRDCLGRPEVAAVTAIGRRPTGVADPSLREVVHDDFADYRGASTALAGKDVAFFCLCTYTGKVSDEELRRVTVDYAAAVLEHRDIRTLTAAVDG